MKKAEKEFLIDVYSRAYYAAFLETLYEKDKRETGSGDSEVWDEIERRKDSLPLSCDGSAWNAVQFVEAFAERFSQDGFNGDALKVLREKAIKQARKQFDLLTSDAHARYLAASAERKMFR